MKAREVERHFQHCCLFVHFPCSCCNPSSMIDDHLSTASHRAGETLGVEENNGSQMRSKCCRSMADPCPLRSWMKNCLMAAVVLVIKHTQMKLDILPPWRDWIVFTVPVWFNLNVLELFHIQPVFPVRARLSVFASRRVPELRHSACRSLLRIEMHCPVLEDVCQEIISLLGQQFLQWESTI